MSSGLPWGLALTSGVNTYLPLFMLALFARFAHVVELSPRFAWLASDEAIIILGALALTELLAQKFPVLDNIWDFLHTLLRPLAGALAAGATLNTQQGFETVAGMVVGGTLAAAAHSTKSGLRLMSTSKSFGTANLVLSLGEDAAVVVGTLLSVYAPWVMLGIVLLFVLLFALIGPRVVRTLLFDLGVLGSWLKWLCGRVLRRRPPASLDESLLEPSPEKLAELRAQLEPGEELIGTLRGWKRSKRGPRAAWMLVTSRRVVFIENRIFRRPKIEGIRYADLAVTRQQNLILFLKLDLLTRQHESHTLSLRKTQAHFGQMALEKVQDYSGGGNQRKTPAGDVEKARQSITWIPSSEPSKSPLG